MGMNLMNIMKTVQKAQSKAVEVQKELEDLEITGVAGNGSIKVICNGQGKFKSIKIAAEAINPENPESVDDDTIEMLEDVITTAVKQATETASKEMETKMKAITGGISIPGLF